LAHFVTLALLGGFLGASFGPPATWIGGLVIGLASTTTFFVIKRVFAKKELTQETVV
jgi:hypothetical protein